MRDLGPHRRNIGPANPQYSSAAYRLVIRLALTDLIHHPSPAPAFHGLFYGCLPPNLHFSVASRKAGFAISRNPPYNGARFLSIFYMKRTQLAHDFSGARWGGNR
jgi:hypothetical protein